jgi:ABC-type transporter Mla MlaB component
MHIHSSSGSAGGKEPSPIEVETNPDGTILLKGELDMATAKQVEDAIAQVMRPGRPVVIDMAMLSFIDSSGIRVLARTYQEPESGSSCATRHAASGESWRTSMRGRNPKRG